MVLEKLTFHWASNCSWKCSHQGQECWSTACRWFWWQYLKMIKLKRFSPWCDSRPQQLFIATELPDKAGFPSNNLKRSVGKKPKPKQLLQNITSFFFTLIVISYLRLVSARSGTSIGCKEPTTPQSLKQPNMFTQDLYLDCVCSANNLAT